MPATTEISVRELKAALTAQSNEPVFHCFMDMAPELILDVMENLPWNDLHKLLLTKNMTLYAVWYRYRKHMFVTILAQEFPIFEGWFFSTGSHVSIAQLQLQQHHFAVALGENQGFLNPATYQDNLNQVTQLTMWKFLHLLDGFKLEVDKDLESFRRLNRNGNRYLDAANLDEAVLRRALFLLRRLWWRDLQAYEPREVFRLLHFSPAHEERVRTARSLSIVQMHPESDVTAFANLLETMACLMINSWNLLEEARCTYQLYQSLGFPHRGDGARKLVRRHLCGLLISVILRIGVQNIERLLTSKHDSDKQMVRRIRVTWICEIDIDLQRMAAGQMNQTATHSMLGFAFCRIIGMWRP